MPRTRSVAWSELKLGAAGIVAVVLTSMLIFAVGGQGGFFWQRYPLRAQFEDVQGLKTGAVVRLNGMEVGKVTGIELVGARVEVTLEVSRSVRPLITGESEASMGTLSLLGEPIVDIRAAESGEPLADGAYLRTVASRGIGDLAATASRGIDEMEWLLADVRAGRGSVGRLFAEDALYVEAEALVSAAARVARQMEKGEGTLGALARDPAAYDALREALADLQGVTARIRRGEGALGRLAADDELGRKLSDATTNVEAITGRLARGEGTAGRLLADPALYDRATELTDRMESLVAALEAGGGTAGLLLKDRELYENLNLAAAELRALVADIRRDPKKYLSVSFSVF